MWAGQIGARTWEKGDSSDLIEVLMMLGGVENLHGGWSADVMVAVSYSKFSTLPLITSTMAIVEQLVKGSTK